MAQLVCVGRLGMPRRHALMFLHGIENAEWCDVFMKVQNGAEAGLSSILLGPAGTGKTQIACDVMINVMEAFNTRRPAINEPLYTSARDLVRKIRVSQNTDDEWKIYNRFKRACLLVIDDFHELSGSDFDRRVIFEIVDGRYANMVPTIIIANQDSDTFGKEIGASAASRMCQVGNIYFCNWGSFRVPDGTGD